MIPFLQPNRTREALQHERHPLAHCSHVSPLLTFNPRRVLSWPTPFFLRFDLDHELTPLSPKSPRDNCGETPWEWLLRWIRNDEECGGDKSFCPSALFPRLFSSLEPRIFHRLPLPRRLSKSISTGSQHLRRPSTGLSPSHRVPLPLFLVLSQSVASFALPQHQAFKHVPRP